MKQLTKILVLAIVLMSIGFIGCKKQIGDPETQDNDDHFMENTEQIDFVKKENLQKTANIILTIFTNDSKLAKNLLSLISKNKIHEDQLRFSEIFNNKEKNNTLNSFKNKFLEELKLKKGDRDSGLSQYLVKDKDYLYVPFPLDDYSENSNTITIVANPIDNTIQNKGIRININRAKPRPVEVIVNNEYAEKYPVIIIMPDDKISNSNSSNVSMPTVNEVKIGFIYCKDYCGGIFEGPLQLHFLRSYTSEIFDGTRWYAKGDIKDLGKVTLARKYVRYARKGWDKGWVKVNLLWDSNWSSDKVQQIFSVYEYDPQTETTVSGTVKFTSKNKLVVNNNTYSNGVEIPIAVSRKVYSDNDILGIQEWNRNWFYKTNSISNDNIFRGSWKYDGWTIRNLSNSFWFTTPIRKL